MTLEQLIDKLVEQEGKGGNVHLILNDVLKIISATSIEIFEYPDFASFPPVGQTGKIYVDLSDGKTYRWSGSIYIELSSNLVNSVNAKTGNVVLDKNDIGLGNVDNTSDLNKPISNATQLALNNKYDSSNPNGYETPSQLNARDVANRSRANHTGSQLASTISNFQASVSSNTDVSQNTTDRHTHTNKSTLDAITEAFTTALKNQYDSAVLDSHTHSNKAILDAINVAFTTVLKTSYDDAVIKAHEHSNLSILEQIQQPFLTSQQTKLSYITITQAVDLDNLESRVNELDAAVVLKGVWDASIGTFPGVGVAQAGWSYLVTVDGIVDGIEFKNGDRIICVLDNASTTVYAGNWYKADYTDRVNTVAGRTGNVTITSSDLSDFNSAVLATLLAGLNTTAGTVTSSDSVLIAIGKLVGNIALKQNALVSGVNIKTINGVTLLGSGDLSTTSLDSLTTGTAKLSGVATQGAAGVYTSTMDATITSYVDKQVYFLKIFNDNTALPTLNINSIGAKNVNGLAADGSGLMLLGSGSLKAGMYLPFIYDQSQDRFLIPNCFLIPSAVSLNYNINGNNSLVTTTSTTFISLTSITANQSGVFLILYSAQGSNNGFPGGQIEVSVFINNIEQTLTRRRNRNGDNRNATNLDGTVGGHYISSVNSGEVIDLRWRVNGATGTIIEKYLSIVKIA